MCHLFDSWRYVVTHVLIVIPNLTWYTRPSLVHGVQLETYGKNCGIVLGPTSDPWPSF